VVLLLTQKNQFTNLQRHRRISPASGLGDMKLELFWLGMSLCGQLGLGERSESGVFRPASISSITCSFARYRRERAVATVQIRGWSIITICSVRDLARIDAEVNHTLPVVGHSSRGSLLPS